jgi:Predicted membrane protein
MSEHVATEYEGTRPVPGEPGHAGGAPASQPRRTSGSTATVTGLRTEAMMARPAGSNGKNGTAAAPAARSGPRQRTLTDMPRAGWLAILKRSIREFKHDDITDRAAALTYYGVLALFPAVLVLVSILGLLGKSTTQQVLSNLGQVAPGGVHTFLTNVVTQVQGKAGAAGVAGIIGIVIALWSASGYVAAFMRASNAIYDVDEGRPVWKTGPVRLLTTLALVIMLVIAAAIVVLTGPIANQVGTAFGIGHAAVLIWDREMAGAGDHRQRYVLAALQSQPERQAARLPVGLGWRILAVIIWLIASGLFAVYVSFSGSYNKTYGSLATVIIFLVWLWISNIAILLGAEFNAETQRERAIRAGLPEDVEPFAELRDTRKLNDPEKRRVDKPGAPGTEPWTRTAEVPGSCRAVR